MQALRMLGHLKLGVLFIYPFKITKNIVSDPARLQHDVLTKNPPKIGLFGMPYFTIKSEVGKYGKRV